MATGTSEMRGQTVLITGGTDGIGFHAAQALAGLGAHVLITGRDERRGRAAAAAIDSAAGRASTTFVQADHSTVGGNDKLAERVRGLVSGLDVLVNNVGGLYDRRWETGDGYEATLAMNFVGPCALTTALLPLLRAAAPARCVNVVSAGFTMYKRDPFIDIGSTIDYVPADAYNRAKLLNLLSGLALADRLAADGITVNAVHPGLAWTRMTRAMTTKTMPTFRYVWPVLRLVQRYSSAQKAGRRVATLAASPSLEACTGRYFEGGHHPKRLPARVLDRDNQQRAWQLAAELTQAAATRAGPHEVLLPGD